jgi:hypothetical protein
MGKAFGEKLTGESWDDSRVGMNVLRLGQGWQSGGPMVLHSPWWLRTHWGRAFHILSLQDEAVREGGQGVVVMQKKDVTLTVHDLEREEPGDTREVIARRWHLIQLETEGKALHQELSRARQASQLKSSA